MQDAETPTLREPVVIGRLTSPYGVKGWLKVHSYTEPRENLLAYSELFFARGARDEDAAQAARCWQVLPLQEGRPHGKGLVLKLHGVDTPEQARTFSGCDLAIAAAQLPSLEAGEFYWHQLEGLQVRTAEGALLGVVDHLLETGANDVMVVRPCEGSIDRRERLVPYLPDGVVKRVDLGDGTLEVLWDPEF